MALPARKANRLLGYDYSQPGMYFITICTRDHLPFLRRNVRRAPARADFPPLTRIGEIADFVIREIPHRYQGVILEKYVVMPNHIHLLLCLTGDGERAPRASAPSVSIPRMIKMTKESVTKRAGCGIWQKGYHDHIVRDEADYLRIWNYIDQNPFRWREDRYYIESARSKRDITRA